jgi:hypothetical protein
MTIEPFIRRVIKALSRMSSIRHGSQDAPDRAGNASADVRFFFDVRCGPQIHRDDQGATAASEAEAIGQAAGAAEDFVKDHAPIGRPTNIDEIIIRNEDGREIARVNVRALGKSPG